MNKLTNQSNSTQDTGGKRVIEELLTAMSWMEPPFVDDSTPLEEIRQRIGLMIEDKERALKYARKRGELSVYQECPNPYCDTVQNCLVCGKDAQQ